MVEYLALCLVFIGLCGYFMRRSNVRRRKAIWHQRLEHPR